MDTDEPKFVQSAPAAASSKVDAQEEKVSESRVRSGWGRQLREDEIDEDADTFLTWIVRYPVERNHPRPNTGSIAVKKSGDAVVCHTNDKLSDVLQKLIVEGFLSMPVLSTHDGRFIGFVDLLDVTWYVMHSFGVWRSEQGREKMEDSKEHFAQYLALERFRNATVADVMNRPGFGHRNLATHVYKGFSLFHVFESMARINSHRVAITNSERKVTGILTQSMVISLLDQHLDRLGGLATAHTVEEILPGLSDELRIVHETDMALTGFKLMVQHNVSGLAVLNSAGELVDTLSVRDLRGMGASADHWTSLWSNVAEFKAMCRSKFPQQTPPKPLFVTKQDTLEKVIKLMDDGNIHRIFVAELRNGKPVPSHCISQRDVLRYLLYLCGLKNTALEDLDAAAEVM